MSRARSFVPGGNTGQTEVPPRRSELSLWLKPSYSTKSSQGCVRSAMSFTVVAGVTFSPGKGAGVRLVRGILTSHGGDHF